MAITKRRDRVFKVYVVVVDRTYKVNVSKDLLKKEEIMIVYDPVSIEELEISDEEVCIVDIPMPIPKCPLATP